MIPEYNVDLNTSNYIQHEAWFEIKDVTKVRQVKNVSGDIKTEYKGKMLINSYGKTRYVFEDGTFFDEHIGKCSQLEEGEFII